MTRHLTPATTLENLKKEAKRWLKALRANDAEARARLMRAYPGASLNPALRDVQHALAREHGLEGWSALKSRLAAAATEALPEEAAVVPLLDAANRGDATRVAALLDARPEIVNERGHLPGHFGLRTALHFAINRSDEATVRTLLDGGADPNIRDEGDNAMPLHFAAEKEQLGIVRLLIEHGADPIGTGDGHELEVIGWATCFGSARSDVVDYLLAHGARHNIFSAVATGDLESIRALVVHSPGRLDQPMDATNHRRRPLHLAVVKKQPRSLAALLDLGADVGATDAAGMTALDQAALGGEHEMADLLIDRGASLRLPAAIGLRRTGDIERLVRADPDCLTPDGQWGTLIVRASEQAPAPVIAEMVRLGASVNVRDDPATAVDGATGYTPLHSAAFRGNAEAVSLLLELGADPSVLDGKYNSTPAGWAEYAGHTDVRDLILAALAADPHHTARVDTFLRNASLDWRVGGSARISAGHTADRLLKRHPDIAHHSIFTAVVCGRLDLVERRLALDPEAASRKGGPREWPPLLYLCSTRLAHARANDNAEPIARALLDRGADPNAWYSGGSNDIHYTTLTCVFGEGEENAPRHPEFQALTRLLFERGADPYDQQVLYNTHFHGDILWLLQEIYAQAVRLGRQADWDDPNWSMLDMGGYGCGARYLLRIAVEKNNLELAEWILTHGASANPPPSTHPRASKDTLYEEALRRGQQAMADLLARHDAPPSTLVLKGEDAFAAACFRVDYARAEELARQHPEYLLSTATIFAAAKRDRADVVSLLLDLGMSVDVQDASGARALHEAAHAGAPHVATLLLERGAEVDARESTHGNTPLGHAVYGRQARTIELLAPVSRDVFKLTWIGAVERLREVLGTEPGLATSVSNGHTLLMWLPDDEARAMEIAGLLLSLGADPSVKNADGQTAADRARPRGLDEVADLLEREKRRQKAS